MTTSLGTAVLEAQPAHQLQDPASDEKAVMEKVSRHLLRFLFPLFLVSFLDRINIGFAGLTMVKDLGLTATQFGFATTLFYLAYIAFGIPSNIALARVGARIWIGTIMVAWGIASSATMFSSSPQSLYFYRVLVGIAEAGFLPGMLLYLTLWFPSAYRARANSMFMIAMPVTAALGSAVSGLILSLDGTCGLKGWQWLFLLEGFPASILGVASFFYMDDSPKHAKWLSDAERSTLTGLLAAEQTGTPVRKGGLAKELLSSTVVKYGVAYFCLVNSIAMVAVWTPLIVKSFSVGATNTTVGLLAAIPQLCTIAGMIWWGRRSDRSQERRWHTIIPMFTAAVGWMLAATAIPWLQLVGVCLASTGAYTAMSIFWTTPDRALSLGARALGIAVINATGNISSAANPLIVGWMRDVTHTFTTGLLYAAVMLVAGCLVVLALPIKQADSPASDH
jgi:ACS family 4-hydroxyphenylacetate permease-like MFS transporter